eukprot:9080140-Karenia_brevis.AAC.1
MGSAPNVCHMFRASTSYFHVGCRSNHRESHHQKVFSTTNVHVDISNMPGPVLAREPSAAIHLDPWRHERHPLVSILLDFCFCQCNSGRAMFAEVAKTFIFVLFVPAAHVLAIVSLPSGQ